MLWTALILGLAGSFHCIGMCGPIAFILPVSKTSKSRAAIQTLLYHFGRLLTYSLIGLLFGLLGKGLYLAGFQQRLSVIMGVLMIMAILLPMGKITAMKVMSPLNRSISSLKSRLGKHLSRNSLGSLFSIGVLNGFLPCGLVYMALIGAVAAGDHYTGALYMLLFGLGTIPMMTVAIFAGNFVSLSLRAKFQKLIPVFIVFVGLLFILRGLGLGIPYISPSDAKLQMSNNPENCLNVEMDN